MQKTKSNSFQLLLVVLCIIVADACAGGIEPAEARSGRVHIIFIVGMPRSGTTLLALLMDEIWRNKSDVNGKHLMEPFSKAYYLSKGKNYWRSEDGSDGWPETDDAAMAMIREEIKQADEKVAETGHDFYLVIKDLAYQCVDFFEENKQELEFLLQKNTQFYFSYRAPEEVCASYMRALKEQNEPDIENILYIGGVELKKFYNLLETATEQQKQKGVFGLVDYAQLVCDAGAYFFQQFYEGYGIRFDKSMLEREPTDETEALKDPGYCVWRKSWYGAAYSSREIVRRPKVWAKDCSRHKEDFSTVYNKIEVKGHVDAYCFFSEQ